MIDFSTILGPPGGCDDHGSARRDRFTVNVCRALAWNNNRENVSISQRVRSDNVCGDVYFRNVIASTPSSSLPRHNSVPFTRCRRISSARTPTLRRPVSRRRPGARADETRRFAPCARVPAVVVVAAKSVWKSIGTRRFIRVYGRPRHYDTPRRGERFCRPPRRDGSVNAIRSEGACVDRNAPQRPRDHFARRRYVWKTNRSLCRPAVRVEAHSRPVVFVRLDVEAAEASRRPRRRRLSSSPRRHPHDLTAAIRHKSPTWLEPETFLRTRGTFRADRNAASDVRTSFTHHQIAEVECPPPITIESGRTENRRRQTVTIPALCVRTNEKRKRRRKRRRRKGTSTPCFVVRFRWRVVCRLSIWCFFFFFYYFSFATAAVRPWS